MRLEPDLGQPGDTQPAGGQGNRRANKDGAGPYAEDCSWCGLEEEERMNDTMQDTGSGHWIFEHPEIEAATLRAGVIRFNGMKRFLNDIPDDMRRRITSIDISAGGDVSIYFDAGGE